MNKLLTVLLVCAFLLAGCSAEDAAGASLVHGKIYIKRQGAWDFTHLYTFQSIKIGEPFRSEDPASYLSFGIVNSPMVLLPNSQVSVIKVKTNEQGDMWATLNLDYGALFVQINYPPGKGWIEVYTASGLAKLQEGTMVISDDQKVTKVYCLAGTCEISADGDGKEYILTLRSNQVSSVVKNNPPKAPLEFSPSSLLEDPAWQSALKEKLDSLTP